MNEHLCIRCHLPVTLEDGHLTYCSCCGAPQIFLSEELQTELAESLRAYGERNAPIAVEENGTAAKAGQRRTLFRAARAGEGRHISHPWAVAVPYALLSAGITLGLGLLSLLLPAFSIFMLLWLIAAPVLTVAFFKARTGADSLPGSSFAARLGLLTGLLVCCSAAVDFTLSLLLTRFAFHEAGTLDTQLAASFDQQRATVLARLGSSAQPTLDLFLVPEYRVGILLSVLAVSSALYLLLSTVAGGVAGLVLGRRRSA